MWKKFEEKIHFTLEQMTAYLKENNIDYECDTVEWFTEDNEADVTEINVRLRDSFILIFYDKDGNMTHYNIDVDY